jgi:O-antigen ligase
MHPWSQEISLALAGLGFVVAFLPRPAPGTTGAAEPPGALSSLLRFPIFWLGGAFLAYILVQGLNPAWQYQQNAVIWRVSSLPHVGWLPHGVLAPFAKANPWRCLMIDGSAWLVVCSLWAGFTRHRSLRILLMALAANAGALALLGLLERAANADRMFWSWTPPQAYFVASFIYKNHAGAFFDLLLGVCAGLAAWYFARRPHGLGAANPVGLLGIFTGLVALIVLFSYSRAATLLLGIFLVLAPLLLSRAGVRSSLRLGRGQMIGFFYAGLAGLLVLFFASDGRFALVRLEDLFRHEPGQGPPLRFLSTRAALDMFAADPIYGWGADGFRYGFPAFQQHYPTLYNDPTKDAPRLYWEHAHDDYAECLAEFGLVGSALVAGMLAYGIRRLVRARFWRNPCTALLVPGCALTLAHAAGDFPFHNPAILLTWCAIVTAAARWGEWDPTRET